MAQDFESLAKQLKEEGGFSVSSKGRSPKTGTMVALEEQETVVPGAASANRIQEFYKSVEPVLEKTRHSYVGGWQSEGKTYLDVSQRFPGPQPARSAIVHRNQLAGYDIDKDEDVTTGQQRMFKADIEPSYPFRRNITDFMGGALHGALGLGERARRAERARNEQQRLPL